MTKPRVQSMVLILLLLVPLLVLSCAPAAPAPKPTPKPAPAPSAPAPAPAPAAPAAKPAPAKKVLLNMPSGSSAGVTYMHAVVCADVINKAVPEVTVTALEGGGGHAGQALMRRGEAAMCDSSSTDAMYQMWTGTGVYAKDGSWPKLRLFSVLGEKPYLNYVRADTGITKPEDLEGKKFCAGDAGGATEDASSKIYGLLGIKPAWTPMSSKEAVQSLQDRRIVGHVQAQEGKTNMAAATIQLMASIGITPLGFTEEQQAKAMKAFPTIPWMVVKAGGFAQAPKWPALRAFGSNGAWVITSDVPQDIQYKMFKAIVAGKEEIGKTYKLTQVWQPIEDEVYALTGLLPKAPPLAAGVVQYAIEKGMNIPDWAIPPEYVAVKK